MAQCWHGMPDKRPDFTEIRESLEDMMSTDLDYLDLDNINVPPGDIDPKENSATSLLIDFSREPEEAECQGAEANTNDKVLFTDMGRDDEEAEGADRGDNWAWISLFGDTNEANTEMCDTHVPLVVQGAQDAAINNSVKFKVPKVIVTQENSDEIFE